MLSSAQKKRAERLFHWKQDGVKALSEHETREQATRSCSRPSYAPNGWPAKQVASRQRPRKRNQKASSFRDDIKIDLEGGNPKRWHSDRSQSRARLARRHVSG